MLNPESRGASNGLLQVCNMEKQNLRRCTRHPNPDPSFSKVENHLRKIASEREVGVRMTRDFCIIEQNHQKTVNPQKPGKQKVFFFF